MTEETTGTTTEQGGEQPAPDTRNIIWVGEGEPPHTWSAGMAAVVLIPETEAEQRAGFRHEMAPKLIAAHDGYKKFRPDKGTKDGQPKPAPAAAEAPPAAESGSGSETEKSEE